MNTSTNTKKASGLGVICYGLGDLASQFIWTFVGSYLTIFYTRSKFGRFRPYIAFGCPFLAVFAVMTFINMGNGTLGVIFSAVVYIIAGMLYTLVNIPYSSLAAVMTEDPKQRNLIGV